MWIVLNVFFAHVFGHGLRGPLLIKYKIVKINHGFFVVHDNSFLNLDTGPPASFYLLSKKLKEIYMKSAIFAFAASTLLAFAAQASLLKLDAGQNRNNGVAISKGGVASIDGKNVNLTTVGSGLRSKKVLGMPIKVYVAQLLVDHPTAFSHTDAQALASLNGSETVGFVMTFLRTVEAAKVQVSFREALDANQVNTSSSAIKTFLDAVSMGGDATSHGTLTIVTTKNADGSETLAYEDTNGKQTLIRGEKGLSQQIFSIWLGQPSDDGVQALKSSLIHSQE
jgi:hypothetical protein